MPDKVTIILEHRRIGEMYEGKVVLRALESDNGHLDQTMVQFGRLPYEDMVLSLSQVMQDWENCTLIFQRTERPGLNPYVMDEATTRQIRESPKAFVEATTVPHVKVDLRKLREKVKVEDDVRPTDSVKFTVKSGHDTIANAFGDEVYCRGKKVGSQPQVEDPVSGRWIGIYKSVFRSWDHALWYDGGDRIGCKCEPDYERVVWVRFSVHDLLELNKERYYLPRVWNTSGPWISHEDLQKKYREYLKEREQCLKEAMQE